MYAKSCKEINDTATDRCGVQSGTYWLAIMDKDNNTTPTKVYCDMTTDGGGWTLVWKHSYKQVTEPLLTRMYYTSEKIRICSDLEDGWCNLPEKVKLCPTEMMIVAYHKRTLVYAYKGTFNLNIDLNWPGATLLPPVRRIVDMCTQAGSKWPKPADLDDLSGLAFDKIGNNPGTDTICNTLEKPKDCRWEECHLPSSISSRATRVQMTMAIFVR
jgi:hypothetical protein